MTDPFSGEQTELLNISSGVEAESEVASSILQAEQLGEKQFSEFCQTNLFCGNPDIFTKIKKNKLKTFSSKRVVVKDGKGQQIEVKSCRNLFARLLVMSKTRDIDLKDLLSYCLGDYPLSLATVSGGLVKTAKAKMLEVLEGAVDNPVVDGDHLGDANVLIVDAMAVLQTIKGKWRAFSEFADSVFAFLVKLSCQWKVVRLDFVADRYPETSIKNAERVKRAAQGVQRIHILNKDQSPPKQWKKYLSSGKNKEELIVFLCNHWSTYKTSQLSILQRIYITSNEKCILLTPATSPDDNVCREEVTELECDHEEADTRLLLHAKHASRRHDHIIIKTPDTDVFIICVEMQKIIGKDLFVMTGTGNKFRIIDTSAISDALGENLCRSLPGFHAFTGNFTSSMLLS